MNTKEMKHADGVLSCPFCGAVGGERTPDGLVNARGLFVEREILADSFAAVVEGVPPVSFRVICKTCGTQGPGAGNEEYAVKLWNRRKAQDDLAV